MRQSLFSMLLLLGLIWGGSYYFIKVLIEAFGPWTIVMLRSGLGLAVISVYMAASGKPFGFKGLPWAAVAAMAIVNTCVPWAIIGFSETRIASGTAAVLNATTPLWALALGILFFGTTARRTHWTGMASTAAGLLTLLDFGPSDAARVDGLGFAGMLAASFFYGLGSHLSRRLLDRITPYQATFFTLLLSTLVSGIAASFSESFPIRELADPRHLLVLFGLGVFGSGLAYMIFYRLVQKGGPEFATTVTYLLPAISLLWGFALLHEPLRWHTAAGLVLILAGVYLSSRGARGGPEAERGLSA
ncbi:DMT family transporter [Cohnella sp. JJ-181]|uniref:DMT family transporter n=1 Tax=Cohnella rhizoplanae TaxID=2974897 RepID=UPI0022FF57D5|nr:DMT family transporter [Cohnella sp. JJ-181]CAI6015659.1 putative cystine transporter YijE [Cohnella sp. JJ-181]